MTVSSQTARNDYAGNGVTLSFPVTFRFLEKSHLRVLRTVIATNVTTELTLDSLGADGFSVIGAGQPAGGTVTVVTAPAGPAPTPALAERLSILRNVPLTQETDYLANDAFPAESHERALDKLTMIVQQQGEVVGRAITLPAQTTGVSTDLPAPVALNLLRWNAAENALENAVPPAIATVAPGAVVDATVSPVAGIQSSKLAFLQAGTNAVPVTVESKLREHVSVADFGAAGGGVVDETLLVQRALNTGRDVLIPEGKTYAVGALTISTSGQRIYGGGTLKALAGVNYQLLRVLANDVVVDGVRFDGTASKPGTGQVNDIIRVESVSGVRVQNCRINGSKGGGIAILNSSRCVVTENYITSVNDNGVLVANVGADDNLVANNIIIGTASQNCIFLTADSSSLPTAAFIYRNAVTGNVCRNATDTGIEVGQHCVDSTVVGNVVANCANPEILIRDAIGTVVSGNVVHCDVNGSATHDGIAWLEHNETNWDYRGVCTGNVIHGRITRTGILLQGANNVLVEGNRIQETVASVNPTTGAGLVGIGIQVESAGYGIRIHDNDIRRMEYGILFNVGAAAITFTDCSVNGNSIAQVSQGIAIGSTTFSRCRFSDNTINSPVLYCVNNSAANGSSTSSFDGNAYNLGGFSGASPVSVNIQNWRALNFTEAGGNDSGWIAPTFTNSWANLGGAYQTAAFRKVAGRVYLRGVIASGTAADGTAVFTLPSGFGPAATESFKVANSNSPTSDTRIEIANTGVVTVQGSVSNTYLSLSGLSFFAN